MRYFTMRKETACIVSLCERATIFRCHTNAERILLTGADGHETSI